MCIKTQTRCSRSSSRERQNELESWMIEQATRESKWVREIVCLLFAIPPQHHHALCGFLVVIKFIKCTKTYIYVYTIMHAHKMCDSFYNSLILCVCVHSRREYIDEDDNDVIYLCLFVAIIYSKPSLF